MEHLILAAMQIIRTFARKSEQCELTEYEVLMYEAACNLIATHSKYHELGIRGAMCETERAALEAEDDHAKWMAARNDQIEAELEARINAKKGEDAA